MQRVVPLSVITLSFMLALLFYSGASNAAVFDDGTYSVNYSVIQAHNDSVSIANDYFQKPATLIVEHGKQRLEIAINQSEWVKTLKAASGESFVDVDVVSEDKENNVRIVTFNVDGDLSQSVLMQMHIVIESMEPVYDHSYTVRYDFDLASVEFVAPLPTPSTVDTEAKQAASTNKALIYFPIALLLVLSIFIIRKLRVSKK